MIVKLLTERHLEFLSLKGGCRGSSESTHVKMPHCWKFLALAHMILTCQSILSFSHLVLHFIFQVLLLVLKVPFLQSENSFLESLS